MSKLRTFTRRAFLIGSSAIAGGVAFGAYIYKTPLPNPLLNDLSDGETAFTPYVKIDQNGITLITPRAEVGQGAYSMQAALIAEELDVELDQIKVDPGMPDKAYYNTAFSEEGAPFRTTDESYLAESARTVVDSVIKMLGVQVTGGSTSVPDAYEKLRYAGAVARETLKLAAAQKTGIDVGKLTTANGAVKLPDGSSLSYVELAPLAATLKPVADVALRDPSTWRLIGKTIKRFDMVAKSTGTLAYGIDFELDGMLHATVKTNPRKGAMNSFDASKAEKMRGVTKIVPLQNGVGVIADNTWRAFQAAEAIVFNWAQAPYPAQMDGHWQALEASFNEDQLDARTRDEGDVVSAISNAGSDVIEAQYRAPYVAHQPLEPLGAVARVTAERIDIWTCTQSPGFARTSVAKQTGLNEKQIFIHVLYGGGSFGHRLETQVINQAVTLAQAVSGTPIKLTYRREEDFAQDFPRQIAMARAKGTVKNGQVESLDLSIAMPSVISSQLGRLGFFLPGPDAMIVAGAWDQPYAIPNYRVSGYRAPELAPISSWRSVGASTNGFFHDCALDELIHAAGADPLAERIRLMWHEPSRKVLEAVGEMSNWGSPLDENRGRGVAFCLSFGAAVAEVVEVTNSPQGIKIDRVFVAAEVGKVVDPVNFENQVQGGVVWGLGHAMNCEITYLDGQVEQTNFDAHEGMRLYQCPIIEVRGLENGNKVRGVGEPPVPPAAAALANAIFAATGKRIREMPFNKHIDFV